MRYFFLLYLTTAVVAAEPAFITSNNNAEIANQLLELRLYEPLTLDGIQLDGESSSSSLVLERFPVFSSNSIITVHRNSGQEITLQPQKNAYFRGHIENRNESMALVSVMANGDIHAVISDQGKFWLGQHTGQALQTKRSDSDPRLTEKWRNLSIIDDGLIPPIDPRKPQPLTTDTANSIPIVDTPRSIILNGTPNYVATIAIETDFEYYQKFGNITDATNYIADIFAFASIVYTSEVDTGLTLGDISLWQTSNDPWDENSTECGFYEFGQHWNINNTGIERTLSHFLSGKPTGGGIAWVGVLCQGAFIVNIAGAGCSTLSPLNGSYGGDYGYTGDIDGDFNINNPLVLWDIVATAHEVGHNFNSPHTHCYAGLEGNANPIDECFGSEPSQGGLVCYNGTPSLPCNGSGCGTIMSYCHLRNGGISNITYTLGQGHPFGISPDRVPSRMNSYVMAQAGPSCLAPPGPATLIISQQGSGGGRVTSAPIGIDCGITCTVDFPDSSIVELTATPNATSTVSGWGGDCSGSDAITSIVMSGDKNCSVEYNLITYSVDLTINGQGRVFSNPSGINCGAQCQDDFVINTNLQLTTDADNNNHFVDWSGDCAGTNSSISFSVTSDRSCIANFAIDEYQLNITTNGQGSVSSNPVGINCGSDCDEIFPVNTSVQLTATPNPENRFINWSDDCNGSNESVTVNLSSNKNCTANFGPIQHLLSVDLAGSGNAEIISTPSGISCSDSCQESFDLNTLVTMDVNLLDASTEFVSWSGDCTSATEQTLVLMDGDKNCTANILALPLIFKNSFEL